MVNPSDTNRRDKGTFAKARLPVSKSYVTPRGRMLILLVGGAAFALLMLLAALDFFSDEPQLLSNGPLSSSHANLEQDCAACHVEPGQVQDEACASCHEKFGDPVGVFSQAAHYIYRSDDFQRVSDTEHAAVACATCHVEHEGRSADITAISDERCLSCHEFGSFNQNHPAFDIAAGDSPAGTGLNFPHSHHVNELMRRRGWLDVEKACLSCHAPEPEGRHFEALDFDAHCGECHLPATLRTRPLAVASAAADGIGVQTIEEIRDEGGVGTRWASFLSPREFRSAGGRVIKSPLYHRDPWLLHNLRSVRQQLFPNAGLADLLTGSADVPDANLRLLYEEALDTLRSYALELRSRPEREVQDELSRLNDLLEQLEAKLDDPYAPLDETKFLLALGPPAAGLQEERREGLIELAEALTQECRSCHLLEDATIKRVQRSLQSFTRAEFNHRAHILEVRCLDCHQEIPILDNLGADQGLDSRVDNASIRNLPKLEQCTECHSDQRVSNACTTCHVFHPNKDRRSSLLLYLDSAEPESSDSDSDASSAVAISSPEDASL